MSKTIDLRKPDLTKVEIGTIVISTKGFEFELVEKDTWKDLTSGITWYPKEDNTYTYNEAIEKFKDRLPTKEEFELAEIHGFRDVIPNPLGYFWSASVFSSLRLSACLFLGSVGRVYYGLRSNDYGVRCISRNSV